MTKHQAKRDFGTEGTSKLRKQWQKARSRGKKVCLPEQLPNYNPDKIRLSKAEKILTRINKKLSKTNPS